MPDAQPRYQPLPGLSDAEMQELRESILADGMHEPVVVDENGDILDGHHRFRIWADLCEEELLSEPCPTRTIAGFSDAEKATYAFDVNIVRRQLSAKQRIEQWKVRRENIAFQLKQNPLQSDREIAAAAGVDHHIVAKERDTQERIGSIPIVSRVGRAEPQVMDAEDVRKPEATYPPDHRNHATVTIIVDYPVPSAMVRWRKDRQYPRESEMAEWQCELVMQTPIPDSGFAVDDFRKELGERFHREVLARPFHTMRTPATAGSR